MNIRRAEEKDIERIMVLLSQVLEVHAAIWPDYFISGTTKYSREELAEIIHDDLRPIYAAVDENDTVAGYAFCAIKQQPAHANLVQFKSFYIDDLCVDEKKRGQHIASRLFEFVKEEARRIGCYAVTLNVWEGNRAAKSFYDSMGFKPRNTTMEYIL